MWRSCSSGALRSTFRPVICAAIVLVTIAWSSPAHPQNDLEGEWVAKQKVDKDQDEVELTLILERAGEVWTGTITDPTTTAGALDLTALRVRGESVSFNFQPESLPYPASFYGNYDPQDDFLIGTFSIAGRSLPMTKFERKGGPRGAAAGMVEEEKKPRVRKHFYHFGVSARMSYWIPIHILEDDVRNINDVTSAELNWDVSLRWYALDSLVLFGRYMHGGLGFDSQQSWVNEFDYLGLTTDSYLKLDGWEIGFNTYVGPALLPTSRFNPYFTASLGRTSWEVNSSGRGSEILSIEDVPLKDKSTAFALGFGTEYAFTRRFALEFEWSWRFVMTKDETMWLNSDTEWTNTSLWALSLGLVFAF